MSMVVFLWCRRREMERKDCCRFMRVIREMEDGWERISFRLFFSVYRDEERE